jgi:hypothetical protein
VHNVRVDVELRVEANERGQDRDGLVQLVIQVSLPMLTNNILYVCIYIYIYMHTYIHTYIERERER